MLYFASSNINKFREVEMILKSYSINVQFKEIDLLEIQGNLEKVAEYKVRDAYDIVKDEVIVEDDGIFIDALNGFPGVYSSYVYKTIGNDGILKLMEGIDNRDAKFISIIAYSDGSVKLFKGIVEGKIAYNIQGVLWGYDPIFIPKGYNLSYAQLMDDKNKISHRNLALRSFAEWYNKKILVGKDSV